MTRLRSTSNAKISFAWGTSILVLAGIWPLSFLWFPHAIHHPDFGIVDLQLAFNAEKAIKILRAFRDDQVLDDVSQNLVDDDKFICAYTICGALSIGSLGLIWSRLNGKSARIWCVFAAIALLSAGAGVDYFAENSNLNALVEWAKSESFADASKIPVNVKVLGAYASLKFGFLSISGVLWLFLLVVAMRSSFRPSKTIRSAAAK